MLEEQLADGREWLFDTVKPGLGDIAAYTVYGWVIRFRAVRAAFSSEKFPWSLKVIINLLCHVCIAHWVAVDRSNGELREGQARSK